MNRLLTITLVIAGFILGICPSNPIMAQITVANCNPASSLIELDVNNVRVKLLNGGDLFWDLGEAGYEVPKGSGVHALFAGSIWMGGVTSTGQLKVAAQTYRQTGNDFFPGPISDTQNNTCEAYDRFWVAEQAEIDQFLADVAINGTLDIQQVPQQIRDWPGRDNPHLSLFELAAGEGDAPFIDTDGDGIYDPTQGDYPSILGDKAIWWVFNDLGNQHSETGGLPLGMQVSVMAYAFASEGTLNNTTFYKYTFHYKGTTTLNDFYVGQWIDGDLGQFDDDYIGCSPAHDMGYFYNGDAVDGQYGANPPLIGVKVLGGVKNSNILDLDMSGFMFYNNSFDDFGNPETAQDYYNYLTSKWKDGSPITQGGNGRDGDTPTRYIYPDNPANPNGWSECTENNEPADRRFLMSAGPLDLEPESMHTMTVAVIWTELPAASYPCPDITPLMDAANEIQEVYNTQLRTQELQVTSVTASSSKPNALVDLYPNPMSAWATMEFNHAFPIESVHLYDMTGRKVRSYTPINNRQLLIEKADLVSGVYFYEVNTKEGMVGSGKLIVD